jgi:metallophosphoesterase (TIGR00282 family)
MIGDVVGDPGLDVLERRLPHLIKEYAADFVTVNGENAAGGFGLTEPTLEKIFAVGADVVTGGNHIWEKREFLPVLDSEKPVLRPMNYPAESFGLKTAGKGWIWLEKPSAQTGESIPWFVVNLQGREFMTPLDCPFKSFGEFETEHVKEKSLILVDFHAESTREKEALAYYLDGRASVVAGTHTHVQTADERILPKGSAYISDLGMTGILDGVIGMDPKICLDRARNQVLYRMEVPAPDSDGKIGVQGILVELDADTKMAVSIKRIYA